MLFCKVKFPISEIILFDLNYDFTKLWTAKESIVKYLGLGFSLDPQKLYFNNEVQDEIYCDGKKLSKLFFKTYDLNGYVITRYARSVRLFQKTLNGSFRSRREAIIFLLTQCSQWFLGVLSLIHQTVL